MECFAEHGPYFHIGADESDKLGECPECRKLGAAGSYAHKVGACIDFVRGKGWTPVMWDDIIRNANKTFSPEEEAAVRSRLGKDAVIMYWAYGYGGRDNQFPYLDEFRDAGMQVWGASGYAGCDNWAGSVPPMAYRALNIDAWIQASVESGLECHCSTGWTRIGSADCPAEPPGELLVYPALRCSRHVERQGHGLRELYTGAVPPAVRRRAGAAAGGRADAD